MNTTEITPFPAGRIKTEFPVLATHMNESPLVYLDNAASTQKPQVVIDTISTFYEKQYATIHRGIYKLSQESTVAFANARKKVQSFIKASHDHEVLFTKGTTESINLVAQSYLSKFLKPGDEVLVPEIEHHANYVTWQQVCKEKQLIFKTIPVTDAGEIDMTIYESLLNDRTKFVALAHVSNVLGTIHPIQKMIELAHHYGAKVLIDGAQGISHCTVDVHALKCDFYCFSGHKLYGPTGIGILYGKEELLNEMPPYQYGGDMIETVTPDHTSFAALPNKFEAGTPPIVEALALGAAIDYIRAIGLDAISRYEDLLLKKATIALKKIKNLRIIGEAKQKAAIISFIIENAHPHDIGTILDDAGIAIRAGHHCSQPTMARFQVSATARASFSFYNTNQDIEKLSEELDKIKDFF